MSFEINPWNIKQNSLDNIRFAESLCSLGNGYMGLRGTFEEDFSGDTHQGQYIGGVWFPDKTRVGWWKNGYPEYFGKAINCVNIIGIHVYLNGNLLDLNTAKVSSFSRNLDMKRGILQRNFVVNFPEGNVTFKVERFVSLSDKELLAIRYQIDSDFDVEIELRPYIDANVKNQDSNYDETFWNNLDEKEYESSIGLLTQTKENEFGAPRFTVAAAMSCRSKTFKFIENKIHNGYVEKIYRCKLKANKSAKLIKYSAIVTDRDFNEESILDMALSLANNFNKTAYSVLKESHVNAWANRWEKCDVEITGDDAAQQGIRFNLFHLLSTYTGDDARLNIGPKGFTGEKYGGATYWDTEAYCLPVYMSVIGDKVARQLLKYRHIQLPEAYINAKAQGLAGALYPMVTFTGLECHNEWEITFEEIHRNAAIAYAIYDYTSYTGDDSYLLNEGYDVLCGIARFWADRVHYSKSKNKYMIHGVTGPNEYENNVNNNWYTNTMATWCLEYFIETSKKVSKNKLDEHNVSSSELDHMQEIVDNMYFPYDKERNIFVQHDTFLDKDLMSVSEIPEDQKPINQHWSWDKVLRSCFIKQADVLQGLYFLNYRYDKETIKRNFDFYEPMTVHESSLSPCVHSILAAQIGKNDKAVEMYLRTARLDLDNINNDTVDGLHITSMAGSWLSIVHGFAGMRTHNGLCFNPIMPNVWQSYSFKINYRNRLLKVVVDKEQINIILLSGEQINISIYDKEYILKDSITVNIK